LKAGEDELFRNLVLSFAKQLVEDMPTEERADLLGLRQLFC